MIEGNKKAAPGEKGGDLKNQLTATPTIPGAADVMGNLELALIGFTLHTGDARLLPAVDVFTPGAPQVLASIVHALAEAGEPIDPLAVHLQITRRGLPRNVFDAMVRAVDLAVSVVAPSAAYYKRQVEAAHVDRLAASHLARGVQLLEGGDRKDALDHIRNATRLLEEVAA